MGPRTREYLYGLNPCFEALRAGRRKVYEGYLSRSARGNPRVRKLADLLDRRQAPWQWVEKGRVHDLAAHRDNQGVALKTATYPYVDSDSLLDQPRLVMLDNVEDPHNVGAILRSADIFGFHGVILPTKGTPGIYPSVVKVSAGASEFLQINKDHNGPSWVKMAREAGYFIVALDGKGTVPIEDVKPSERLLVVVGGEDRSVGQFILNEADAVAQIPQRGHVNSLNASVAAGLAMYRLASRPVGQP